MEFGLSLIVSNSERFSVFELQLFETQLFMNWRPLQNMPHYQTKSLQIIVDKSDNYQVPIGSCWSIVHDAAEIYLARSQNDWRSENMCQICWLCMDRTCGVNDLKLVVQGDIGDLALSDQKEVSGGNGVLLFSDSYNTEDFLRSWMTSSLFFIHA